MSKTDIYADEALNQEHSFRYIHIKSRNVVGILSRISSLMRRKRYNMEEVSVSFDDDGHAHIVVAIDGRLHDVNHVIEQLRKLYDIFEVEDVTHEHDRLYFLVYVKMDSAEEFKLFPISPDKTVELEDGVRGIFTISLEEVPNLMQFLHQEKYPYIRRIMGLI